MNKVLYRSADIRREIGEMFASARGRRVAITAFVGEGAEAFLCKHEGIRQQAGIVRAARRCVRIAAGRE